MLKPVLFLFLIFCTIIITEGSNPIVRVSHGVLQGSWKTSTKGNTYASFEGIPYARPPIGKYRFREPQSLKPWSGVWDATKTLSDCLQYDPFFKKITGDENCLFVNVYTPKLTAGTSLPVLVYIHGGAFLYGTGSLYRPTHLMDWDMVVVTLNYRLGPLGFLSTGDDVIPGNIGLKDQAFALQWVKDNIMMFGGNPDSVTLTGCSAGGASVHYHYLSPWSKGTFARGIAFSGSALSSWTHAVKPAQKAKALASIIGCPTTSSYEILECLKYRPAKVIVNAQLEMFDWKVHMFTPFTPTIESPRVRNPFLTQYPYHVCQAGGMHKLPLITSVTSEEGIYPAGAYQKEPGLLEELESKWEKLASNIFEYNDTLPLKLHASVAAKIKQHYLGGQPVNQETYPNLVQALGDRLFSAHVGKLAQIHALKSGQPVYVYRFSYRGNISFSELMSGKKNNYGVSHGDDVLIHLFKFPGLETEFPDDVKMREIIINMVYSYSTTGTPHFSNNAPQWLQVKPGSPMLDYMEIGSPTTFQMKSTSDFGQTSFWDSLEFIENENYHNNIKDEL